MSKKISKKSRDDIAALVAAKTDIGAFAMFCFDILYPGKKIRMNWHIEAILYQLQLAFDGERQRLIINIAPRHLKSFLASVVFPAWILAHKPGAHILCLSYSDDLGKTFSRQFRRIVGSPKFKAIFPDFKVGDKDTEGEVSTTSGGYRATSSVSGTLTGRGADYIIIDDPIKSEDAKSDAARTRVNEWFDETLYSRLDDKGKSVCILVMQRFHQDDLTGHLENDRGFVKIAFPSIATSREVVRLGHGRTHVREEGDILHPEHENAEVLADAKKNMGPFAFAAQYQQNPVPVEGNLFKREWIKEYAGCPDNQPGIWVWSWDTASSTSENADYSVGTRWYVTKSAYYLFDIVRGKYAFPDLRDIIIRAAQERTTHAVLIENADSGEALISSLRRDTQLNIIPMPTGSGKLVRAQSYFPAMQAGRVLVRADIPCKAELFSELLAFPRGKNDDIVDSITHFLAWASGYNISGRSPIEIREKELERKAKLEHLRKVQSGQIRILVR